MITSQHALAFGILAAAWGEDRAQELWDNWTPEQRAEMSSLADTHFRPVVQFAAMEMAAWLEQRAE